jgi:hypothetical protein
VLGQRLTFLGQLSLICTCGCQARGALLAPRVLRSGGAPGWAKAPTTSAIIVGLVGALLGTSPFAGVFGGT